MIEPVIGRVITLEPLGFRDVYWCGLSNEPVIIEYEDSRAKCVECNWISSTEKPDEVFLTEHVFVCHLCKPKW